MRPSASAKVKDNMTLSSEVKTQNQLMAVTDAVLTGERLPEHDVDDYLYLIEDLHTTLGGCAALAGIFSTA